MKIIKIAAIVLASLLFLSCASKKSKLQEKKYTEEFSKEKDTLSEKEVLEITIDTTLTLGVKSESGTIPLDSLKAGMDLFFETEDYTAKTSFDKKTNKVKTDVTGKKKEIPVKAKSKKTTVKNASHKKDTVKASGSELISKYKEPGNIVDIIILSVFGVIILILIIKNNTK